MAQQNGGGFGKGKTTAIKVKEEKQGSGVMPYVIGGLAGVAVGLIGSMFLDKPAEHLESQAHTAGTSSRSNDCAVCLDETTPTFRTRCCGQLMHAKCLQELRNSSHSRCPYCRSRAWLG